MCALMLINRYEMLSTWLTSFSAKKKKENEDFQYGFLEWRNGRMVKIAIIHWSFPDEQHRKLLEFWVQKAACKTVMSISLAKNGASCELG